MKLSNLIKIFLPLLLICAVVAGLVAAVNLITEDKIAENEAAIEREKEERKLSVIEDIYGDKTFSVLDAIPDGIDEIRMSEDGAACVTLTCDGYQKKSIQLFVAFDVDMKMLRVTVLSSNETTGIGTRVGEESYLSQFAGRTADEKFDKIAGATFSSKAVMNGVARAAEAVNEVNGGGSNG